MTRIFLIIMMAMFMAATAEAQSATAEVYLIPVSYNSVTDTVTARNWIEKSDTLVLPIAVDCIHADDYYYNISDNEQTHFFMVVTLGQSWIQDAAGVRYNMTKDNPKNGVIELHRPGHKINRWLRTVKQRQRA